MTVTSKQIRPAPVKVTGEPHLAEAWPIAEFPLLPVVVGGQNHVFSSDYDQTNIALSVLRGLICQRTEHLCTCARALLRRRSYQ